MTSFLIPISTTISNIYRWSWTWWFSAPSSNEKNVPPTQIKSRRRRDKAEFSRNCIVPLKFVKDYVDHLGQMKCVRKSEEMKVKGRKRSGWKKITTTFNESNCKILTKCRRWKFMNLICTWYDMESCLRGRSQRKWHIYSTYRWQDLIRHYGERDFVKKA